MNCPPPFRNFQKSDKKCPPDTVSLKKKCKKSHNCKKYCCKSKPKLITVGPTNEYDFSSVQKALDKIRTHCVINGPTTIKIAPGVYKVTDLTNLFAANPGDFFITGDERIIAGFSVASGLRINLLNLPDLGSGISSITLLGNTVTINATGIDLTKQSLKKGDKIYITGTTFIGTEIITEEYIINSVNANSLILNKNISASLLSESGMNGLTVTFQPNVKFISDAVLIETALTLKGITWEGNQKDYLAQQYFFEIRSKVELNNMVISFYEVFVGRDSNISNTGFNGSPVTLINFVDMGYINSLVTLKGLNMTGFIYSITFNTDAYMDISNGFYSGINSSDPIFILIGGTTAVTTFDITINSSYQFVLTFKNATLGLTDINVMGGNSIANFLTSRDNSSVTIDNSNINLGGKVDNLYFASKNSTIEAKNVKYTYNPSNVPNKVYHAASRSFITDKDNHSSETPATVAAYEATEGSFIRGPDIPGNRWPGPVITNTGGQVF